jgi:glycosidase
MKNKILFFFCMALALTACSMKPVERIATGQPIMPIRMTADTMHVELTDYIPMLSADSMIWETLNWEEDKDLPWVAVDGDAFYIRSIDITNPTNTIRQIGLSDGKHSFAIPVLPKKPVMQNMISLGYEDGKINIGMYRQVQGKVTLRAYVQNMPIEPQAWSQTPDGSWMLNIAESQTVKQCAKGRAYIRVFAETEDTLFNDLMIPLQDGIVVTDAKQLTRHDQQAQVLYSILIDRFYNGNKDNDWKMNSPEVLDIVDYQGGDFAGITEKILEGYFDSLGINTLWISPITQNPEDAWGKYVFRNGNKYDSTKTYTRFSGYHGYWPIYATQLDWRLGTDKELKTLLRTAHEHGINVVQDYVANHMHINSPTLQQHPDWHTDSILPDGRRNFELWDDARLTTWFDVHIPTLDLERPEVCEPMTDSALYWLEHYDFDGYRHDACKHIPEGYWRMLGQKIATRYPDRALWMIGETYGSPELINTYVKTGMLNAQFDFNVYFTLREALCEKRDLQEVAEAVLTSLATYGSHHTMGNISGNHDQVRFASLAGEAMRFDEDDNGGKETGWTRNVGIGDPQKGYGRSMLLEVINLTLPGVPCIYQGDEYAEVGANDPDNRHMMRFEGLSPEEQAFRAELGKLIHQRRASMPLLYGDYIPMQCNEDVWQFCRFYMGQRVVVTIDRKNLTYQIEN